MPPQPATEIIPARGYAAPVVWATPQEAAAVARHILDTAASGDEITRNPHLYHPWARNLVNTPVLAQKVQAMVGDEVAVENSFLVIKWPGRQFVVPAHQDGIDEAIELDPALSVCCWAAITPASIENGCLHIVPGSHRWGYLPYQPETGPRRGLTLRIQIAENLFTPMPVPAGQAVFFDPRLIHRSGPNTTDHPRIGLNIRYTTPNGLRRGTPEARPGWMALNPSAPAEVTVPGNRVMEKKR